jgi:type IV pilus assembly protein PilW
MTLIEMMVALVIGLILSLAIFSVMSVFEGRRRTVVAGSDLDQAAGVAMFQIDRWTRSAGTGFAAAASYGYGCELFAVDDSGGQILPMKTALPDPFAAVDPGASGVFRLAPVLILPGQTSPGASNAVTSGHVSDVLVLMSAGNGGSQVPTPFTAAATTASLTVPNTLAFSGGDLVLLADRQPAATGGIAPCMVTQAGSATTSGAATAMPLDGARHAASIDSASVGNYSMTGVAINLGNVSSARPPSFQLLGVGDNNTLYSYDLLQTSGTALQARAEGVFEMHALYGIGSTSDATVDAWVSPGTGSYTVAALSAGTPAAAALLRTIRAVRIGLIMRTALPERSGSAAGAASATATPATSLTLFSDLDDSKLTYTRALAPAEQQYRYRTLEATIPLRNNGFQ